MKRNLAQMSRTELEELVHDLYATSKSNQFLLHTRCGLKDTLEPYLKPYKDVVSRWLSPNVLRDQYYSVSQAKKAISDYRKAVGDPEGLAELCIFYCETGVEFANEYGPPDASYYTSIVSMFKQSLKFIQEIEPKKQVALLERLDWLRHDIKFGHGVEESLNELLQEYDFDDDE